LTIISGNYGKRGGNLFESSFVPNWRVLMKDAMPRSPVSGYEGVIAHVPVPMFSPFIVPEEIEAGNLHAMIVEGSNPLLSFGDSARYKKAYEQLELLVVIDPAMTETARMADYVLPTPVGYEKWEFSFFGKGHPGIYGHLRPPVVQGPELALPEAEIYSRLSSEMGLTTSPPALLKWLGRRAKHKKSLFTMCLLLTSWLRAKGNTVKLQGQATFLAYQTFSQREQKVVPSPAVSGLWMVSVMVALTRKPEVINLLGRRYRWTSPFKIAEKLFSMLLDNPGGVELARLDEENMLDYIVQTKDKKIRLLPEEIIPLFDEAIEGINITSEKYPYFFAAGNRTQWNANNIHRSPDWRKGKGPHFCLQIHPELAEKIKIKDNDIIEVENPQGAIRGPAKLTDKVHRDVISAPHGFGVEYPNAETGKLESVGQNLNLVVSLDLRDPVTGVPYIKNQPCLVRRVEHIGSANNVNIIS